jgi:hypothetical protein
MDEEEDRRSRRMIFRGVCGLLLCSVALAGGGVRAAEPKSRYLCKPEETVVFGCDSGGKMISVCGSPGFTGTTGYLQYRFGTPSKIELAYPETPAAAKGRFWFSHTDYSGGDEAHLRFVSNGVVYAVFDRMIRTNFIPGQPNNPAMSEGVAVRLPGKKATARLCRKSAGDLSDLSSTDIDQEDFDYDLVP